MGVWGVFGVVLDLACILTKEIYAPTWMDSGRGVTKGRGNQ